MDPHIPESLAARPRDERRGLPIPVVNEFDDGQWDFTAINGKVSAELAQQRRCGVCGQPMGYWVALLGGPGSARSRSYVNPPMHVECAEAAIRLCPHIARPGMKRATDNRLKEGAFKPATMSLDRPEQWVMYITRNFEVKTRVDAATGAVFASIRPAPAKRLRVFEYDQDGVLHETNSNASLA